MRAALGGKGANLAEMSNLGLPVPPGFTITTEVCTYFMRNGGNLSARFETSVDAALARVGELAGGTLGDPAAAAAGVGAFGRARLHARHDGYGAQSGPQPATVEGLAKLTGDARFAYDSYRRFIQMYSRRRARAGACAVRGNPGRRESNQGRRARHRSRCRRPEAHRGLYKERVEEGIGQAVSGRRARAALGRDRRGVRLLATPRAPRPIASCTIFPKIGAPRSTCRRWCSATAATTRPPA